MRFRSVGGACGKAAGPQACAVTQNSGSAAKTAPSVAVPALSGREKGGRSSFLFDLWTAVVSAPATGCRRRTAQGWSSQLRPPLPRPCSRLSPTTRRRSPRRRTTPTTRSTDGTTSGGTPFKTRDQQYSAKRQRELDENSCASTERARRRASPAALQEATWSGAPRRRRALHLGRRARLLGHGERRPPRRGRFA